MKYLVISMLLACMFLPMVSAQVNVVNTFNDSDPIKNLTFSNYYNLTWLSFPEESFIVNGSMEFTGNVSQQTSNFVKVTTNATHNFQYSRGAGLSPNGSIFVSYGNPVVDGNYTFYVLNISGCFDYGWTDPTCILNSFLLEDTKLNYWQDIAVSDNYFWIRSSTDNQTILIYDLDGTKYGSFNNSIIDTCHSTGLGYKESTDDLYVMTASDGCNGMLYVVNDPLTGSNVEYISNTTIDGVDHLHSVDYDNINDDLWGTRNDAIFRANLTGYNEFSSRCYANTGSCPNIEWSSLSGTAGIGSAYYDNNIYLINNSFSVVNGTDYGGIVRVSINISDFDLDVDGENVLTYPDDLENSLIYKEVLAGSKTFYTREFIFDPYYINDYVTTCIPNATGECNVPFNFTSPIQHEMFVNVNVNNTFYYVTSFIVDCSLGGTPSLNFTFMEEETLQNITADIEATFTLNSLSGFDKNTTYSIEDTYNLTLCIIPDTETYNVDATIYYENENYEVRTYYFDDLIINNQIQNYTLILINSTFGEVIDINLVDSTNLPVNGALINIQRHYIGNNTYRTVAIAKTDFDGKGVTYLRLNDVPYKFIIIQDGIVLANTDTTYVTSNSLNIQLDPGTIGNIYNVYGNVEGECEYTPSTMTFECDIIDVTGASQTACLIVDQRITLGIVDVCNTCGTGSSINLQCSGINTTTGMYYYNLYVNGSQISLLADYIYEDPGADLLGLTGVFGVALLLIMLSFFSKSPSQIIILETFGFGIAVATGLINVAWVSVISISMAGAFAIYVLRK